MINSLMTLIIKAERHEVELKELRDETKELAATIQQLIFERQRDRDNAENARQLAQKDRETAEKDRELLLSRLKAKLLTTSVDYRLLRVQGMVCSQSINMPLQCEICGDSGAATALGGRLCDKHRPNERQCSRCGSRLWGWPEPPASAPCSSCLLREQLPELTKALTNTERELIQQYVEAGQTIFAIRELGETLSLPLKDAIEIVEEIKRSGGTIPRLLSP